MDNERRHQLQQNELADQLDKAKTWIEPYVAPILVGVIAITLIGIVVNFIQSQRSSGRSEATVDLLFSTAVGPSGEEDPEVFDRVAKNFPGTAPGDVALISKADVLLAQGIDALFRDRSEAETLLTDAASAYEKVLETTTVSLLKSRAQFGLAQALESQSKVKEAIDAYEKVVLLDESEGMTEVAQSRIAMLSRPDTAAFASWFAEQKPQAFDPATPPGMPDFGGLPGMPSIQLPGVDPVTEDGASGESSTSSPLGGLLDGPLNSSDQPLPENTELKLPEDGTAPGEPAADSSPALIEPPAETTDPPAVVEEANTEGPTDTGTPETGATETGSPAGGEPENGPTESGPAESGAADGNSTDDETPQP